MIQETIHKAFNKFAQELEQPFQLKGIFFDMDGVLFNSMPLHAKSWIQTFKEFGLTLPEPEPYMNEGSTAFYTVRKMFKKYLNKEANDEVCEQIKNRKHEIMGKMPKAEVMVHMQKFVAEVASKNIDCWVVTGSAQEILISRLMKEYDFAFERNNMITAHDVKIGKPNPEPYLNAMKKSGYSTSNAFVIENAPLGVESAKAAGLFTIAINTGPIDPSHLKKAGADLVLDGSKELLECFPILLTNTSIVK
ncbi:MAG: HAD family phosphatase [Prolixibacteraceae bacterium]|jgi:beta-phosphoglucomutase|nr:HAD family phosphatase [Prolixibacteraceae bacterium]